MGEKPARECHNARTEIEGQQSLDQESKKSTCEDCQQEVTKIHFECSRCQDHNLERRRRWQHRGKHQRPKFMAFKRCVNFLEALSRKSLAQQNLSTGVADD